jgi:phosphoglycerate dehydrogenase-like enzyme
MTRYKTLLTTRRSEFHQQQALRAAPPELAMTVLRDPDSPTLQAALLDADYWISEREGMIDAHLMLAAPRLKLIQRLGRLTEDIDLNTARARGIPVCYMPVPGVIRVAEHIIMQALVLLKRARQVERVAVEASGEWGAAERTTENVFRFNWSQQDDIGTLWETKVGILGMGEIGIEVATRLVGWDCVLFYYKRSRYSEAVEDKFKLLYAPKKKILQTCDVVINLLPYSRYTDKSLDAESFATMKPGAVFVSAGSGSVIDEAALAEAVKTGKLAGAALDTYEYEPIQPDNPLIPLVRDGKNVLLTPHTAAAGGEKGRKRDYENILRHIKGEPLRYRMI